jgi:ribosomal protein RSM22 (predicted rRNA methylase)
MEGLVMQLPLQLCHAIELATSQHNLQSLTQAAIELSEHYRAQRAAKDMGIATAAHRLAYAAVRMPATFAAARAVFREIRRFMPDRRITSLLDLGAGPGTAGWAAIEVFDGLQQITLVDQDVGWIRLGKALARSSENSVLAHAEWVHANLCEVASFPAHDLVVSSYALGEIDHKVSRVILQAIWAAARTAIVIIEPGTMQGFALIRWLRDDLIALGGHVAAPCPHHDACPMPTHDWCHFSQRVERSSLHRRLKIGTLGYEDEKFSYIVASKHRITPVNARVIRHPQRHSGHTRMRLCTGDGLQTITVTRSDKAQWKCARKIEWGDEWP